MSTPQGSSLQVDVCTNEQVMSRSTAKELVDEIVRSLLFLGAAPTESSTLSVDNMLYVAVGLGLRLAYF
jgi:hypothetical protein